MRWCRRSFEPVREFTRMSSVRIVPEITLKIEICPRNSLSEVLNTSTIGGPSGSGAMSTAPAGVSTMLGPTSPGAGPTRQMKSASWSVPIGVVAEPQSTGNTSARSTASWSSRSS
jgi:hypothetical protein